MDNNLKNSHRVGMGGQEKYYGVYEGIVKVTSDFQRMGRLQVWVPELGTKEDDPDGWVTASYLSPFGGASNPDDMDTENTESFEGTQRSYGFWAVPPDKNNIVAIQFLNGEAGRAIWVGCLYQQYTNKMVPNIPVGSSFQYSDPVPVAEHNRSQDQPYSENETRPFHKTHYEGIRNQGLMKDTKRGYSQHGATSFPTPTVYGMLTPKGHYWSMEDTDGDEKIRLRTRNGGQILIDDTNSLIFIINRNGNGWIEIDQDGKIMLYSKEGVSIRTEKDFSVTADRDITFEAGRNTLIKTKNTTYVETKNLSELVFDTQTVNVRSKRQEIIKEDHKRVNNNETVNVGGNYNRSCNGRTNIFSNATMWLRASTIFENCGGSCPSPSVANIPDRPVFVRQDVHQAPRDNGTTYRTVQHIAPTYPTHEPSPPHGKTPDNRSENPK